MEPIRAWVDDLHRENLCLYFILPLVKLSPEQFVKSNIINAYLTLDGTRICVRVVSEELLSAVVRNMHPNFEGLYYFYEDEIHNSFLFVYWIPKKWEFDVMMFRTGLYSLMSSEAKELIKEYSSLPWKAYSPKRGKVLTDTRLLGLYRHAALRLMWERYLDVKIDPGSELLSKPEDDEFIDQEILEGIAKGQS